MMYKLPYRLINNILYYDMTDYDKQSIVIILFISKNLYILLNEMRIDHPFVEIPKIFDENSYRASFPISSTNIQIIYNFQRDTHSMVVDQIDTWKANKSSMSKDDVRKKCNLISHNRNIELRIKLYDMVSPYLKMSKEEYTMLVMTL